MKKSTKLGLLAVAIVAAGIVALCGGCGTLGNGKLDTPVGAVDIATIAKVADMARPGAGAAILSGESTLQAALGTAPKGPFGSLPYKTERQVVLKDGTTIKEDQIAQIVEILTPVVPAAIVRVVVPRDYVTVTETPTSPDTSTTTTIPGETSTTAPAVVLDPDVAAALEE